MANERGRPGEYIAEAKQEVESFEENRRTVDAFLALVKAVRRVGDLDVRLDHVARDLQRKGTDPAASEEERDRVHDALRVLSIFVQALEHPEQDENIWGDSADPVLRRALQDCHEIKRVRADSGGVTSYSYDKQYKSIEEAMIHALVRTLEQFLDEYITSAEATSQK